MAKSSTDWNTRLAPGALPLPTPVPLPSPTADSAVWVPWPESTSWAPSGVTVAQFGMSAPGQSLMAVMRELGMSVWAPAWVPSPRPVSATATVWLDPS